MPTAASTPANKSRAKAAGQPPTLPVPGPSQVSEAEIAARAFELYLARGCQDGRDLDDWLQAERELRGTAEQ
jgi:hypothetical protein